MADGDSLIVSPRERLNDELRELIRCHKADLLQAEEIKRLVRAVGMLYGFAEAEHREALEVALSDPPAALQCFREIARTRGLAC